MYTKYTIHTCFEKWSNFITKEKNVHTLTKINLSSKVKKSDHKKKILQKKKMTTYSQWIFIYKRKKWPHTHNKYLSTKEKNDHILTKKYLSTEEKNDYTLTKISFIIFFITIF